MNGRSSRASKWGWLIEGNSKKEKKNLKQNPICMLGVATMSWIRRIETQQTRKIRGKEEKEERRKKTRRQENSTD